MQLRSKLSLTSATNYKYTAKAWQENVAKIARTETDNKLVYYRSKKRQDF